MKQLLAVAAGAAIVTPAWLEACHSERIWFIVQDKHMGVDAKAENSWNFNMWSTFCNTQKYGPLLLGVFEQCQSTSSPDLMTCSRSLWNEACSHDLRIGVPSTVTDGQVIGLLVELLGCCRLPCVPASVLQNRHVSLNQACVLKTVSLYNVTVQTRSCHSTRHESLQQLCCRMLCLQTCVLQTRHVCDNQPGMRSMNCATCDCSSPNQAAVPQKGLCPIPGRRNSCAHNPKLT
eukprot:1137139-Pelagomonas_calceolata.AAC.10